MLRIKPKGINIYDQSNLQRRLFSPLNLPLALWLDASDRSTLTVLNNQSITMWQDKSNFARHATGFGDPLYSETGLNGRPAINFLSTSFHGLQTASFDLPTIFSFVAVVRVITATSFGEIYTAHSTSNAPELRQVASTGKPSIIFRVSGAGAGVLTAPSTPVTTTTSMVGANTILVGSVNGSTYSIRQNGSLRHTTTATAITAGSRIRYIGRRNNGQYLTGLIGEIIETTSDSLSQITLLEGYLSWKWGISLAPDHPFFSRPPLIGDN